MSFIDDIANAVKAINPETIANAEHKIDKLQKTLTVLKWIGILTIGGIILYVISRRR